MKDASNCNPKDAKRIKSSVLRCQFGRQFAKTKIQNKQSTNKYEQEVQTNMNNSNLKLLIVSNIKNA